MSLETAVALHREGRLEEAADAYREILGGAPGDFEAAHLLGVIALQQGKFDAARQFIGQALQAKPDDVGALGNLGTAYLRDGQLQPAAELFRKALALQPDSAVAAANVGTVLHHMGRYEESVPLLRKARDGGAVGYGIDNLLGAALLKCGELDEARELFSEATRRDPQNAEGWANLAVASNDLGRHAEAVECADKAVALRPDSATSLGALAVAQLEQGRTDEAIISYRKAVALPGHTSLMLLEFASLLLASGLNEEAIEQLHRAIAIDGGNIILRWALVLAQLKPICGSEVAVTESRRAFSDGLAAVSAWYGSAVSVREPFNAVGISQPFHLAYHPFNNRELLTRYGALCALWMSTFPARGALRDPAQAPARSRRLRVGIVSAHIQDHSVWNAITSGWVYHFDRSRFELELFQLKPASDQETDKARRSVDHFENGPVNLASWVEAIGARGLDVLIYPEIGMDPLTVQLAALRLAPVQAASWGHPECTGLPTIDFYISGDALEPADGADNYSEKLLRLPNLGVYVEPRAPAAAKPRLRALNLPRSEPLLLCPGSPFKYSPFDDDVWVQIAKRLKKRLFRPSSGGRLVFFRSRSPVMDGMLESRLRAAFARGGVDFDAHVSLIPTLERARFFGLMRESALMLDTLGFSGFNTALQGIECDLPVLAYEGQFMRGRLASAIMRRLQLPELVATSKPEFVDKAVELAGNPGERRRLRTLISERRQVLFRDMEPIRALEAHLLSAVGAIPPNAEDR